MGFALGKEIALKRLKMRTSLLWITSDGLSFVLTGFGVGGLWRLVAR